MKRYFEAVGHWWAEISPGRSEIEFLLGRRPVYYYAPWLRKPSSLRQWVIASARAQPPVDIVHREVPRLLVLQWSVRLAPEDPLAWIWARRKSKWERLTLAQQVYRVTLRRLLRAINRRFPFDEVEYRKHLILPTDDLATCPSRCNLHLLALVKLRYQYETYWSIFEAEPGNEELDESCVRFPFGKEFADRIRIGWRAQFVAEYAGMYWHLISLRNARKANNSIRRENMVFRHFEITEDRQNGDLVSGRVAIPAVDGLNLSLFP